MKQSEYPPEPFRLLCYGIGNLCRGDDAQGPLLVRWLEQKQEDFPLFRLQLEEPFQLQPEDVYDLKDADGILFMDADAQLSRAIQLQPVTALPCQSAFFTHALPPGHLLALYRQLMKTPPPPAYLLSLSTNDISLGSSLSAQAETNISSAMRLLSRLMTTGFATWETLLQEKTSAVF
ncbi:MAG: hypothetical protein R3208_05055 [Ketobacteraceae bacterium]|nr:hypothetical protein [Ketobacteraceae bacterium]